MRYSSPQLAAVFKTTSEISTLKSIGGELGDETHINGFAVKKIHKIGSRKLEIGQNLRILRAFSNNHASVRA
jgi:hypothetical protein